MQGNHRNQDHSGGLVKTLTLLPVVMIGLAYIQPMTLFDTFGIVSQITSGHVPSAYALALLGILFTAFSYGKLVVRFPSAGSAYTYAQKTLSPAIGFMVGWSSLLDYLFMPMINILLAKIYFEAICPQIPSSVFVVLLTAFMVACNLRSLKLVAGFNGTIVCIQMGVVAVIVGLISYALAGQGTGNALWSTKPFWDANASFVPMMAGAAILCFSIVFIVASYFLQLYFPDVSAFKDPEASQPEIMLYVAGPVFQSVILVFSSLTVLASGMAAHAGVSRLMYVMGRDGVLPSRFFARLHPKWHTPVFNIVLTGLLCLSAVKMDLVLATALINFGALVAFTFVNVCVIAQFFVREGRRRTASEVLHFLVLPLCGCTSVGVLWINLESTAMILGLTWASVGLIYLGFLTKGFRNPVPELH